MEPLEPEIFQNGIWYELRGEQYYPCLLPPEPDHTEEELLETIIRQMAKAQGRESVRIDTHQGNAPMRAMLERSGYVHCGSVYLETGEHRVAYEKCLG